ncbi:MAG: hypothetical protein ACK53L_30385, partial [Pirellulaceae bacterium]
RDAAVHLAAQPTPVSFHGHTHRQGGWREGEAGMERLAGERIVRLQKEGTWPDGTASAAGNRPGGRTLPAHTSCLREGKACATSPTPAHRPPFPTRANRRKNILFTQHH